MFARTLSAVAVVAMVTSAAAKYHQEYGYGGTCVPGYDENCDQTTQEPPISLTTTEEPRICCQSMNAECLSCAAGQTEDEYCAANPSTAGCPDKPTCCKAMTAGCLACNAGQSVDEYCAAKPTTVGCPSGPTCCKAMTATCLACNAGQSLDEYCAAKPGTVGCPRTCCQAMTATCLSCQAGQSEEEYCAAHPNMDGCEGSSDDHVSTSTSCKLHIPTNCVFPFTYKGLNYTTCTAVDAVDTLWCSTAKEFKGHWRKCTDPCKNQWPVKKILGGVLAGSVAATGVGLIAAAIGNQQKHGEFNPFVGMANPTTLPPPKSKAFLPAAPADKTVVLRAPNGNQPGVELVTRTVAVPGRRLHSGAEVDATGVVPGVVPAAGTMVWAAAAAGLFALCVAAVVASRRSRRGSSGAQDAQQHADEVAE